MDCMDRRPLRSIQDKRNTSSKAVHPPLLHTQRSKGREVAALAGSPGHSREVCCFRNRDSVSPESMRKAGKKLLALKVIEMVRD